MSFAAPWSQSAAKTFPADFGSAPEALTTATWVLKPVVAPQERSKTNATLLPLGAGSSETSLFSQGSAQAINETDNATSGSAVLKCDTAHRSTYRSKRRHARPR
jgi:hypothetical protein